MVKLADYHYYHTNMCNMAEGAVVHAMTPVTQVYIGSDMARADIRYLPSLACYRSTRPLYALAQVQKTTIPGAISLHTYKDAVTCRNRA